MAPCEKWHRAFFKQVLEVESAGNPVFAFIVFLLYFTVGGGPYGLSVFLFQSPS